MNIISLNASKLYNIGYFRNTLPLNSLSDITLVYLPAIFSYKSDQ